MGEVEKAAALFISVEHLRDCKKAGIRLQTQQWVKEKLHGAFLKRTVSLHGQRIAHDHIYSLWYEMK